MKIIFASQNQNKSNEIKPLLSNTFEMLNLFELNYHDELHEEFNTLEENALQKARFIHNLFNQNCFADDSGLEISELNNEPGVNSAKYAGNHRNNDENIQKVLNKLTHSKNRKAQFRTIIALIFNGKEYFFEGIVKGTISNEKKGEYGFGYDPIFTPDGQSKTFAEMSKEEKNQLSHRAIAVNKLVDFLNRQA